MARLGRGRRIKPTILRGISAITPTPLVRKRTNVTQNANESSRNVVARFKRHVPKIIRTRTVPPVIPAQRSKQPLIKRNARTNRGLLKRGIALVIKAPSVTTPTPLIRNRIKVVPTEVAVRRATFFKRHIARIARGVSTTTPTPLIRKRIFATQNGGERRNILFKKRARIVLRSHVTPIIVQPGKQPLVKRAPKINRGFVRRGLALVVKAPSVTTPTPLVRKRTFIVPTKRALSRATFLRRHVTLIKRARSTPAVLATRKPVVTNPSRRSLYRATWFKKRVADISRGGTTQVAVVIQPKKQPLIRRSLRRGLVRRGIALVTKAPSVTTPTPLVRKRLVLTNRKSRLRAFGWRNGTVVTRSKIRPTIVSVRKRVVVLDRVSTRRTKHKPIIIRPALRPVTRVRKPIVQGNSCDRFQIHHKNRPTFVGHGPSTVVRPQRAKQPIIRHSNRSAYYRTRAHGLTQVQRNRGIVELVTYPGDVILSDTSAIVYMSERLDTTVAVLDRGAVVFTNDISEDVEMSDTSGSIQQDDKLTND